MSLSEAVHAWRNPSSLGVPTTTLTEKGDDVEGDTPAVATAVSAAVHLLVACAVTRDPVTVARPALVGASILDGMDSCGEDWPAYVKAVQVGRAPYGPALERARRLACYPGPRSALDLAGYADVLRRGPAWFSSSASYSEAVTDAVGTMTRRTLRMVDGATVAAHPLTSAWGVPVEGTVDAMSTRRLYVVTTSRTPSVPRAVLSAMVTLAAARQDPALDCSQVDSLAVACPRVNRLEVVDLSSREAASAMDQVDSVMSSQAAEYRLPATFWTDLLS